MISRFHYPSALPDRGEVELPPALAHHALRVLRLRDGEQIVLFDGAGGEYAARLLSRGKKAFAVLGQHSCPARESSLPLVLVQALAAGDKMDWVVQKAVELGVSAIQPVRAERSLLRLEGARAARRREHWQQIAIAACEQSGRNHVPPVAEILSLPEWLANAGPGTAFVLTPGTEHALGSGPQPRGTVQLMIGPEGGWSAAELATCERAGCIASSLGPRVLRTETAGLAAVSVLQACWGDFRAST